MTTKEKLMYEALKQISHSTDCARFCSLIARKALEKMRDDIVEEVVVKNEQAIEMFEQVWGKREWQKK